MLGIAFLAVSLGLYGWLMRMAWWLAITLSAVAAVAIHLLLRYAARVDAKFKVDTAHETSGAFTFQRLRAASLKALAPRREAG